MQALWVPPKATSAIECSKIVCNFLDVATTSFGRATHYNSRQEQQAAELRIHDELLTLSRDLYAVLLVLPGVTDRAVQMGMKKLLSTPRNGVPELFISAGQERMIIEHMIQELPAQRMMKLFDAFRIGDEKQNILRANNARTRKLILSTLLSSPRLQLWVVKYRSKVRRVLTHAWGKRLSSIISKIVSRDERIWTSKESRIMNEEVFRYAYQSPGKDPLDTNVYNTTQKICECIRFAFGNRDRLTLPLLTAFERAKFDLYEGTRLPMEVLEGIRSTYHKAIPKEKVLEVVKDNLTTVQKMQVQKRAEKAGVKVDMDPLNYDAIKLYIYAFEKGLTDDIARALAEKGKKAAEGFPARYDTVGIIVDASASMAGDKTQPLRPMASALAMRDMLVNVGKETNVSYCGGLLGRNSDNLDVLKPSGDTEVADQLLMTLSRNPAPEAVFVISDGYENAPAGRFAEVVTEVRRLGISTPIYHLNPVFAAETKRCKQLSRDVSTLPVQSPNAMGTGFVRNMIESDPERGINVLINMAMRRRGLLPETADRLSMTAHGSSIRGE